MKLDFSHFSDADLVGWLYKVNQFFAYYNTRPEHRFLITSFHLEGKVVPWFRDLEEFGELTSWVAFTYALQFCFEVAFYDDPIGSSHSHSSKIYNRSL